MAEEDEKSRNQPGYVMGAKREEDKPTDNGARGALLHCHYFRKRTSELLTKSMSSNRVLHQILFSDSFDSISDVIYFINEVNMYTPPIHSRTLVFADGVRIMPHPADNVHGLQQ